MHICVYMCVYTYMRIYACVYMCFSSIYLVLPGQYRLRKVMVEKISFLASSYYHGNHFANFLAHILSWFITYHHAEFHRSPPTGLAGIMVQTYRQTDRQTDEFFFSPDMPPGIKPSHGGSPPSLKVWLKSNRGILRNGRI